MNYNYKYFFIYFSNRKVGSYNSYANPTIQYLNSLTDSVQNLDLDNLGLLWSNNNHYYKAM